MVIRKSWLDSTASLTNFSLQDVLSRSPLGQAGGIFSGGAGDRRDRGGATDSAKGVVNVRNVRPPAIFSVGERTVAIQQPRTVISAVGPKRTTVTETMGVHRPTEQPRRVAIPPPVVVSAGPVSAIPQPGYVPPTRIVPTITKAPEISLQPVSQPGDSTVALDLGNLITQLGTAYIGAKYAPTQPMYTMPTVYETTNADFGIPFVDVIPEAAAGPGGGIKGQVWNPSANCGAGKWQRKSRRRRKRLATSSDLKDLAALKGVLGGGKAFEVWIATHS